MTRRRQLMLAFASVSLLSIIRDLLPIERETYTDRLTYNGIYEQRFEKAYDPRLVWEQRLESPAVDDDVATSWLTDDRGAIVGVRTEFDATEGYGLDAGIKIVIAGVTR